MNILPHTGFIIVVFLIGLVARISGLHNDLWLDEIWAINASQALNYPWEVFTKKGLDGHCSLYTFIIWFLGAEASPWQYRFVSFAFSLATLRLVFTVWREREKLEKSLIFAFFSLSYMAVLLGSESRGYSPMFFFCLFSYHSLKIWLKSETLSSQFLFGLSCAVACLFHFSAIQFYMAAFLWSAYMIVSRKECRMSSLKKFLFLHATPISLISAFYYLVIRNLSPGSGPLGGRAETVFNTFALTFGASQLSKFTPGSSTFTVVILFFFIVLLLIHTFKQIKSGDKEFLFFLLSVFIVPILLLLVVNPRVVVPRYFFISSLLIYAVLANMICTWLRSSRQLRSAALAILVLVFIGLLSYNFDFLKYGRGQYQKALSFIKSQSSARPISISSDNDFRNNLLIEFFDRQERDFEYRKISSRAEHSQWYIVHNQDPHFLPQEMLSLPSGANYNLENSYPFTALSGWSWFVYRLNLKD